jgi:hypothetical protein
MVVEGGETAHPIREASDSDPIVFSKPSLENIQPTSLGTDVDLYHCRNDNGQG